MGGGGATAAAAGRTFPPIVCVFGGGSSSGSCVVVLRQSVVLLGSQGSPEQQLGAFGISLLQAKLCKVGKKHGVVVFCHIGSGIAMQSAEI